MFILRPACVTRTPQHIQQVPGLEGVTAALAVEVPVADGTPYHSLPLPPFATPGSARDPTAPPLLLWVTAEALALLFPPQRIEPDTCAREQGDAGDTALPGQRDENQMGREGTLVLMASLLHVGVAAAARHLHVLQVECWRPPRAVHVEVEGDHAPCAAAWRAALAFMHDAASQWPLKKVRALAIASRYEWEEPQHLTTSVIYQNHWQSQPRLHRGSNQRSAGGSHRALQPVCVAPPSRDRDAGVAKQRHRLCLGCAPRLRAHSAVISRRGVRQRTGGCA